MSNILFDLSKKGNRELLHKIIDNLIDYNLNPEQTDCFEICIKPTECNGIDLNFTQRDYNREWGGEFVFKTVDEVIAKEIRLPDKHYELVETDVNEDEYITNWVEMNGNKYAKNDYGQWYDIEEQKAYEKMLKKQEKGKK